MEYTGTDGYQSFVILAHVLYECRLVNRNRVLSCEVSGEVTTTYTLAVARMMHASWRWTVETGDGPGDWGLGKACLGLGDWQSVRSWHGYYSYCIACSLQSAVQSSVQCRASAIRGVPRSMRSTCVHGVPGTRTMAGRRFTRDGGAAGGAGIDMVSHRVEYVRGWRGGRGSRR